MTSQSAPGQCGMKSQHTEGTLKTGLYLFTVLRMELRAWAILNKRSLDELRLQL